MESSWGYRFNCEICGAEFRSVHVKRKYCKNCRENQQLQSLYKRWINTSMCIICGELNPFYLLLNEGHHVLGRGKDRNDITVTLCANCHGLTKPRSIQGFFLFNNRKFPLKSKFTEDNSNIYIFI